MERLYEKINKKIYDLNDSKFSKKKESDFLHEFVKKINPSSFESYFEIPLTESIISFILMTEEELDFDIVYNGIKAIEHLLIPIEEEYTKKKEQGLDEVISLFAARVNCKDYIKSEIPFDQREEFNYLKRICKKYFSNKNGDIDIKKCEDFAILISSISDDMKNLFEMFDKIFVLIRFREHYACEISKFEDGFLNILEKGINYANFIVDKKKTLRSNWRAICDELKTETNIYSDINSYACELFDKEKKDTNRKNKLINSYQILLTKLKRLEKEKIIDINNDLLSLSIDDDIKIELYKTILKHNLEEQEKEKDKYKSYTEDDFGKMRLEFSMFGFDFMHINEKDREVLLNSDIDKIISILKEIKKNNFDFITLKYNNIGSLLLYSEPEIFEKLRSYTLESIIDNEFIKNNEGILFKDSNIDIEPKYNILINNIDILKKEGLLYKIGDKNILLMDKADLLKNIALKKEYNIASDECVDYIYDSNNYDIIDEFIELEEHEFIKENPEYIDLESRNIVKRSIIAKMVGNNIVSKNNRLLSSIRTEGSIYPYDDELDDFMPDYTGYFVREDIINLLENVKRDNIVPINEECKDLIDKLDANFDTFSLAYEINDIVVSRNRIIRNLNAIYENKDKFNDITDEEILIGAVLYNKTKNIYYDDYLELITAVKSILIKDKSKVKEF